MDHPQALMSLVSAECIKLVFEINKVQYAHKSTNDIRHFSHSDS